MKFIGITGGVGAGKSEVLKFIKQHYKCKVYMADKVAFEVRMPGTECHKQLCELLGEEVVGSRKEMAEKLFNNEELLEKVNAIIHPAVKVYLLEELEKAKQNPEIELFFVEAALLIECGYSELVDEMWYVYADKQVRIQRLMASRAYTPEKIESIMANQLSEDEFRANSNFVIDNSGSIFESGEQIRHKLEGYTWVR